jgi:hypothetical protein
LQQGLINFLVTADATALERQFAGNFGEVFRAMVRCGLPAESEAQRAALDSALDRGEPGVVPCDFRPLLARMLCAPTARGSTIVAPEQLPPWLRADYAAYISTSEPGSGTAGEKKLCAVASC